MKKSGVNYLVLNYSLLVISIPLANPSRKFTTKPRSIPRNERLLCLDNDALTTDIAQKKYSCKDFFACRMADIFGFATDTKNRKIKIIRTWNSTPTIP